MIRKPAIANDEEQLDRAITTLSKVMSTKSLAEKASILEQGNSFVLKEVLKYALDPFITFGIANITGVSRIAQNTERKGVRWADIKDVLMRLSSRSLTGGAARQEITDLMNLSTDDQRVLISYILKKDLRAGIGAKTINKVWSGLIPEFNVMLAEDDANRITYPCIVEPKYNGTRVTVDINDLNYYSRNGMIYHNYHDFDSQLSSIDMGGVFFDGEVITNDGKGDLFSIMTVARRKHNIPNVPKLFMVFDFFPKHHIKTQKPFDELNRTQRKLVLEAAFNKADLSSVLLVTHKIANDMEELFKIYQDCINSGYEGVVVKTLHGAYEFKRTHGMIKLKPERSGDYTIVDVEEGQGKYEGKLGAFVVDVDGVKVNVGSGFLDKHRISIDEAKVLYTGRVCEVLYTEKTPDGSLQFPRIAKTKDGDILLRPDKE